MKGVELKPKKETHCSCRGNKGQAGSALPQDVSEKVKRRLNCLSGAEQLLCIHAILQGSLLPTPILIKFHHEQYHREMLLLFQ